MELKRDFENIDIEKVKKLYKNSFEDSDKFIEMYFSIYKKYFNLWTLWDKDEIVLMTCLNKKRIKLNNKNKQVGIIVAVAVAEKYRGKGIMKNFMNNFLDEAKLLYEDIFIQAKIWELYKSWNFHICTKKYKTRLKKDQFLKTIQKKEKVNYDQCNKIYNTYLKNNNFNNFTYRTNKENKIISKMIEACGDKIIQADDCYLILSNNEVIDYAFIDLKNFIRLLSNLPYDTKIWAHQILDKRFFNYLNEEKIETKILDKENLDILFSEYF